MNILVIAPHPDDEVLGCGATIAKQAQHGHRVSVCLVTKAYTPDWPEEYIANRAEEIKKAHVILDIKKAYELNFPTVKLDIIPQKELNDALAQVVKEVQPDVVYIPHAGDINTDHCIVHHAALVATRPHSARSVKQILCYEVPSETEWGTVPFVPNVYGNVEGFVETKIKAMQAYGSEVRPFPHPRSLKVLEALALKRGSEAGFEEAEAFVLVRELSVS